MSDGIEIVTGWRPGAIGDITALHGRYYAMHWNFGPFFEAKVAGELAAFVRDRHLGRREMWCAMEPGGGLAGAVSVDGGAADHAHLRWFIVAPRAQGLGLGGRLLDAALAWCRARGFAHVHLWTFAGLDAARRLYESRGFVLTEERPGETWGTPVTEQRFELIT